MILTKIELDRRHPAVRQDLRDCQDMHRSLIKMFGGSRQEAGVLYRVHIMENAACVYVLSNELPGEASAGMRLAGSRDVGDLMAEVKDGQTYAFDLLAAPCKKVAAEGRKNSRRVVLRTPEERQAWLENRGTAAGFRVLWVRESGQERFWGCHNAEGGGAMVISGVRFSGALQVVDAAAFHQAYARGIGPGKAYGFGMLLLVQR